MSSSPAPTTIPGGIGQRVATSTATAYRPYRSLPASSPDTTTWAQIDLGSSTPIDAVRLYPASVFAFEPPGAGFPARFRIEVSDDADLTSAAPIFDATGSDFPHPGNQIVEFDAPAGTSARYVRVTATRLETPRLAAMLETLSSTEGERIREAIRTSHVFALSKIDVVSGGRDIAERRPVTVDPEHGSAADAAQLTRPPRPDGEDTVTDNPDRVTDPATWRPAAYRAQAPVGGVRPTGRLFTGALRNNARYLLDSFTANDLVYRFRERAGLPFTAPDRETHAFWEDDLIGSNAGRFLMGAANTLRWLDDPELRDRLAEVVAGIAESQEPDGYLMAYPRDTFLDSERGAYTRSWVTQGLIEAGKTGHPEAFDLLRGHYDYYNAMPELPVALRECGYGPQGTVANTRMYFTPVGKPDDIQTVQRYLQEDYWIEALGNRQPEMLSAYPYDRQHSYLLTCIEPYADLYRATGDERYLRMVEGAWEMYRDYWQAIGGSISMIEFKDDDLHANPLHEPRGEICGSVFWMLINQRLHNLDPEQERYVAEIEKSIYNVIIPSQVGGTGIRYHTMLLGKKEIGTCINTCCEGQGTRMLGSLPEFIYSIAADGLYVNLFERSTITWTVGDAELTLEMDTDFPERPDVALRLSAATPTHAIIRIRVPSWATGPMEVRIGDELAATGDPGSYVALDREWRDGDTVTFGLPAGLTMVKYDGIDQVGKRERYAVLYGPVLMAALTGVDTELIVPSSVSPLDLVKQLTPIEGEPLHFAPGGLSFAHSSQAWMPYYEVDDEFFTSVPFVRASRTLF